jgi:hypothetical protein
VWRCGWSSHSVVLLIVVLYLTEASSPPRLTFIASRIRLVMSNSSRHASQPPEDWDHPESTIHPSTTSSAAPTRVAFPSHGGADDTPGPDAPLPLPPHAGSRTSSGKRTLSDLLKLHAEKGTNVHCTPEEAARLGEVLGQWVRVPRILLPSRCRSITGMCFPMLS